MNSCSSRACASPELHARYDAYVFTDPSASQFDQALALSNHKGTSLKTSQLQHTDAIELRLFRLISYTTLSDAYLTQLELVASMS
ncbi:hypothetical protein K445DRAFT_317886 [Daldinia sp. EC12]|nr:hypothetical protein K445DRAFT_317886 [Daldinia sp. EC12]